MCKENNIILLGKLSWGIVNQLEKLWVQVLTKKYLGKDSLTKRIAHLESYMQGF